MKNNTKTLLALAPLLLLSSCGTGVDPNLPVDDTITTYSLKEYQNKDICLNNPHKGIYQHYYDNNNSDAYYGGSEEEILSIPGINHLFIRMAWSYLEPQDGVYDFSLIDNLLSTYKEHNISVSLDVTCKETGIKFATPYWLYEKGIEGEIVGSGLGQFKPKYDDPMFLTYLERFHKAMNEHYKDETAIENIAMGSIGDWGEGHSGFSGGEYQSKETLMKHIKLYQRCYPNRTIVIGDDYIRNNMANDTERQEILDYCVANKIGMRDDSILVQMYVNNYPYSVVKPEYFPPIAAVAPTTIECEHYHTARESGVIAGVNCETKGRDMIIGAIKTEQCTYFSWHGSIYEWLNDNPDFTKEIANLVGYWYFPSEVKMPKEMKHGETYDFTFKVSNNGVARAYNDYNLVFRFENKNGEYKDVTLKSNNQTWLPKTDINNKYSVKIPSLKSDLYTIKVGMNYNNSRSVLLALDDSIKDNANFYTIASDVVVR